LIFYRHFVELPAKKLPLLDYFWDISRDWERLQRTTTQLCMGDWTVFCWFYARIICPTCTFVFEL